LKAEQIGLGFMAEVPLVITDVMRGGPSTGLPTRPAQGDILQIKAPTHGDFVSIALCPGNLDECYTEVVRAFNLAERFMTPVFVLLDETLGHMVGKAVLPDLEEVKASLVERKRFTGDPKDYRPYDVPEDQPAVLNPFFEGYRYHITGLHHGPTGFPTEDAETCQRLIDRLFNKILKHKDEIESYEEFEIEDDLELLIIAYGSVSLAAKEAIKELRKEGVKVGLFRPITLWPSPEEKLEELGRKYKTILVAEMNKGQYLQEIQRAMGRKDLHTLLKANGRPISPTEFKRKIKEILGK
jgi:2-oxoglutarate ferredoxin oxidoreductase subunit alpha